MNKEELQEYLTANIVTELRVRPYGPKWCIWVGGTATQLDDYGRILQKQDRTHRSIAATFISFAKAADFIHGLRYTGKIVHDPDNPHYRIPEALPRPTEQKSANYQKNPLDYINAIRLRDLVKNQKVERVQLGKHAYGKTTLKIVLTEDLRPLYDPLLQNKREDDSDDFPTLRGFDDADIVYALLDRINYKGPIEDARDEPAPHLPVALQPDPVPELEAMDRFALEDLRHKIIVATIYPNTKGKRFHIDVTLPSDLQALYQTTVGEYNAKGTYVPQKFDTFQDAHDHIRDRFYNGPIVNGSANVEDMI